MRRAAPEFLNPFYPVLKLPPNQHGVVFSLRSNFGQSSFVFDIEAYCKRHDQRFSKFKRDAASLPPDVLHLIFHQAVWQDYTLELRRPMSASHTARFRAYMRALTRLSLVCQDWHRLSRPVCFRTTLLSEADHVTWLCKVILTSPTGVALGSLIVNLHILGPPSSHLGLILVSSAAGQLRALRTLSWDTAAARGDNTKPVQHLPPRVLAALPTLFQAFASLTSLVLSRQTFSSFRRLDRLVCALPRLAALALADVYWPDRLADTLRRLPHLHRHPCLRSLEVFGYDNAGILRCYPSLFWLFLSPNIRTSAAAAHRTQLPPLSPADAKTIVSVIDAFIPCSRWCETHSQRTMIISVKEKRHTQRCKPLLPSP